MIEPCKSLGQRIKEKVKGSGLRLTFSEQAKGQIKKGIQTEVLNPLILLGHGARIELNVILFLTIYYRVEKFILQFRQHRMNWVDQIPRLEMFAL